MNTMASLRVGRVFNLGNFESLRLEVELPVRPDQRPSELLARLEELLERMRPVPWTVDLDAAYRYYQQCMAGGAPPSVDEQFGRAQALLSEYRAAQELRLAAQLELDNLGGTVVI